MIIFLLVCIVLILAFANPEAAVMIVVWAFLIGLLLLILGLLGIGGFALFANLPN